MAEDVKFTTASGAVALGAETRPAGTGRAPGLVVVQEWFGINAHMRSVVDRLAGEGFIALAPDLYDGKVATDAATAGQMLNDLKWPEALQKIAAAVKRLGDDPRTHGRVGIMGFCMGGAATLLAAANIPGLTAAVPYYGIPPAGAIDWAKVRIPVQGHYARIDDWVKPEAIEKASKEVNAHGGSFELHFYDAGHAFNRDGDPATYNAEAAKTAWGRSMSFLRTHLA